MSHNSRYINDMCILNNQCYDHNRFQTLRYSAIRSTVRYEQNGYRNRSQTSSFNDPRTGEVFDYEHAINSIISSKLVGKQLKSIIVARVSSLTLAEADFSAL